jgi:hypothetical protein
MLATFAIAEDTPQAPGISIHDMFKLRQMWDDLQNNSKKDFSLNIRPNDICFKNHVREEEVCIHKAILAEMIFEAVKSGQTQMLADLEKILTKFKQTDLPEFNVGLKVNNPAMRFDKNHRPIIDPNDRPGCNFTVATPTESFVAKSESHMNSPREVKICQTLHVDEKVDVQVAGEFDPRKGQFTDYMLHMKNLEPKD